ncbi:MAG: helix-turn-helix domain-containing protein [bacterium]
MNNPLEKIRKKNGWSIEEFASVADMSFTAVYNALNGSTQNINSKILEAVEQLGYDPEKVRKEYQEFREAKKQKLMQEAAK